MRAAAGPESWDPAVEVVGLHLAGAGGSGCWERSCFQLPGDRWKGAASRGQLERGNWSGKGAGGVAGPEPAAPRGKAAEQGPECGGREVLDWGFRW